jgi:hypothetical protein
MSTNDDDVEILTINETEYTTSEGTAAVVEAIEWLGNFSSALPALSDDIGLKLAA